MLADMQLLNHRAGEIVIGYENGSESNAKAEGNIRGTYGQKVPQKDKARDFLGIQDKELSKLLMEYPENDPIVKKEKANQVASIYKEAGDISARIFLEDLLDENQG